MSEPSSTDPVGTASSPTTRPAGRTGAARWILVVFLALVAAAGIGYAATFIPQFAEAEPWVVALAFAACTVTPVGALFYVLIIVPTLQTDPHTEDSVESRWVEKAMAGAALDTIGAAGVALIVVVFTSVELPVTWVLTAVVGLLMADTVVRYVVLSRRDG